MKLQTEVSHLKDTESHLAHWFTINHPNISIGQLLRQENCQEFSWVGGSIQASSIARFILCWTNESVRTNTKGFGRPIQVHATELVVPEKHIFPLFQAEQSKLEGGSGTLPMISMPFEQGAPMTPGRSPKNLCNVGSCHSFWHHRWLQGL